MERLRDTVEITGVDVIDYYGSSEGPPSAAEIRQALAQFKERNIKQALDVIYDWWQNNTGLLVGFSTEYQYRDGYAPFTPGFKIIPFGNARAWKKRLRREPWPSWSSPYKARQV
jgi:hypothetical protein